MAHLSSVLRLAPIAALLALSTGCEYASIRYGDAASPPEGDSSTSDSSRPDGSTTADSGSADSGADASVQCVGTELPARPVVGMDGDDGEEHIFVFTDWIIFPTAVDQGFNLDDRSTSSRETASCIGAGDTIASDEACGVDNAYRSGVARVVGPYFDSTGQTPQDDLHALQRRGVVNMLIRIRGWSGGRNDRSIQVDIMQTACGHLAGETGCDPTGLTGSPLAFDGTDTFFVSQESVVASDDTLSRVVQDNAYVADGVLVARIPDETSLSFPVEGGRLNVGLSGAHLTGILPAVLDGSSAFDARLSGRWSTATLNEAIFFFALCPPAEDHRAATVKSIIDGAADIMADPSQDNMGLDCNAISASITMRGFSGLYGGWTDQVLDPIDCSSAP